MCAMYKMYSKCQIQKLLLSDCNSPDKNDILILSKLTDNNKKKGRFMDFNPKEFEKTIYDINQNYRKKKSKSNKLENIFRVLKYEDVLFDKTNKIFSLSKQLMNDNLSEKIVFIIKGNEIIGKKIIRSGHLIPIIINQIKIIGYQFGTVQNMKV